MSEQGNTNWRWFVSSGEGRVFNVSVLVSVLAYISYKIAGGGGWYYWLAFPHSLNSLSHDYELWRLVTPAFMHFSLMHLLVNVLTFYWLLLSWPKQWSTLRLVTGLVATAVASHIGQYLWAGPAFGGLSGVVFGIAGIYIGGVTVFWLRPVQVAIPVLSLPMIGMLLLMLVLGFAGVTPGLADMAHLAGLLSGMLVGAVLVFMSPTQHQA